MHILDKIVAHKRSEVAERQRTTPVAELRKMPLYNRETLSLKNSILTKQNGGVIAEFKRKSPSKQDINLDVKSPQVTPQYQQAGAAGISILTDEEFFGGHSEHLQTVRELLNVPVLRKDFTIDTYQIEEAKAIGADAILLIARILSQQEMQTLTQCAHDLGLDVLVEVHGQEELDKCPQEMDIIGVNNRNLDTFEVNYQNSIALKNQLPETLCKISESGIHNIETMVMLRQEGFDGFLIGEMFMAKEDPGLACQEFLTNYYQQFN